MKLRTIMGVLLVIALVLGSTGIAAAENGVQNNNAPETAGDCIPDGGNGYGDGDCVPELDGNKYQGPPN